jgi:hypothetical protein
VPLPKLATPYADVGEYEEIVTVTLTFECVCRGGGHRNGHYSEPEILFWYAYADDPETALLLRAAYLPGQVGDVQRREKVAYINGLLTGAAIDK